MSVGRNPLLLISAIKSRPEIPHASYLTFSGLLVTCLVLYAAYVAQDVFFGPLSHVPGPKLWAASHIPKAIMLWTGSEARIMPILHGTYGPVVRIAPRELSFNDASAWKAIYGHKTGGKTRTFEKDPTFYTTNPQSTRHIGTADDPNHTRQRRILANSFSDKALRDQEPLLKRWAGLMVTKLKEVEATGKPVDMVAYYNFTTFDIMSDLTFGESLYMLEKSEYAPWVKDVFGSVKVIGKFIAIRQLPFMPWLLPKLIPASARRKQKEHEKHSSDRVDRRLACDPGRPDLWTEVLRRSDDGMGDATAGMSLREMHANAAVFMMAGTETTATLLSGLTYYLLISPDKLAKLVAEVRGNFTSESDITVDALAELPYLNACIEEGLRMYPPVSGSLPRKVPAEGAIIAGTWVPGDVSVAVNQRATYQSSVNFRNPASFVPERFLGDPEYANDNLAALQPFSVGPRNCIGKNLAYHEMRLLLTMTLLNFDISLEEESKNWANQKVFIFWDKKPLMVKLKAVR
ncbi:benzoate 4-monooxygenase cytochrome P450, partial [Aureobasidium melanogenum]